MINAQDLKGVLAIMPTPAKEGSDRLDATNTVDLDETARIAESLGARRRHRHHGARHHGRMRHDGAKRL